MSLSLLRGPQSKTDITLLSAERAASNSKTPSKTCASSGCTAFHRALQSIDQPEARERGERRSVVRFFGSTLRLVPLPLSLESSLHALRTGRLFFDKPSALFWLLSIISTLTPHH
jgi:hypothetical protein